MFLFLLIICVIFITQVQNQQVLLHKSWNLPVYNPVSASLLGLCALSINNDNCYLAYPGSATIGEVQVFDTINLVRIFAVSSSKDAGFENYFTCSERSYWTLRFLCNNLQHLLLHRMSVKKMQVLILDLNE